MASPKGKSKTEAAPAMSTDELLKLYRTMLLIRRFEERAGQLYGMGLIGGFCTSTSARKPSSSACRQPW